MYAFAYTFNMALLLILVKLFPMSIAIYYIVLGRYLFNVLFLLPYYFFKKVKIPQNWNLFIARACFIVIGTMLTYYAYRRLPLSLASAVGNTEPFFSLGISYFYFNQKVNKKSVFCIIVGYLGVILCLYSSLSQLSVFLPLISLLIANGLNSMASFYMQFLSKKFKKFEILFFGNMTILIGLLLFLPMNLSSFSIFDFDRYVLFLFSILGFLTFIISYCYIKALEKMSVFAFSSFQYIKMVIALFADYFIFYKMPSGMQIVGSLIIASSISFLTYFSKE